MTTGEKMDLCDLVDELADALNYVADNTYCGADAEWHFKPGYDPQVVLDVLVKTKGSE